jgi:pimeloyl-ACP methyl ester carboxylesterase
MPPDIDRNQANQNWLERQKQLARLSSSSKHVIAEKSDHYVQLDQPEIVVDVVRGLV